MKIYRVEIVEPLSEEGDSYEFSNPEKTIKKWFELGEKYPMCVGILLKHRMMQKHSSSVHQRWILWLYAKSISVITALNI